MYTCVYIYILIYMHIYIYINLRWVTLGFSVIIDRESELCLSLWVRVSGCSHSQSMVNSRMRSHVCVARGGCNQSRDQSLSCQVGAVVKTGNVNFLSFNLIDEDLIHALSTGTWSSWHVLYFFGVEPPTLSRWPDHGARRRGAFRRHHALSTPILHGFKLFLGFSLYHSEYRYSTFIRLMKICNTGSKCVQYGNLVPEML